MSAKFEIYNDEQHSYLSLLNILKEAQEVIMYLQQDGCDPLKLPHNFSFVMMSKETNLQNDISCILENASPRAIMVNEIGLHDLSCNIKHHVIAIRNLSSYHRVIAIQLTWIVWDQIKSNL